MERLKKARGPVRASFTRTFNLITTAVAAETPDKENLEVLLVKLERLSEELGVVDSEICKLLLDLEATEEDYDSECISIEEYKDKRDLAKLKVGKVLKTVIAQVTPLPVLETSQAIISKRKFKLPKLELAKFGGEVKDWLTFWSQFKKIHEDDDIVPEDKFQYLIQAMITGTRARELVCSFPPTAENYPKVIDSLKGRFGKDELLIEVYVREMLKLVIQNVSDPKKTVVMSALYDKVESYLRALESIGMASNKYAAMLLPLVESCLPEDILRTWQRGMHSSSRIFTEMDSQSTRLHQLLEFLRKEVEGEERISLAREGFGFATEQICGRRIPKKLSEGVHRIPTANDLFSGESCESRKNTCVFCEKKHESSNCFQAQKMSLGEKKGCLAAKNSCFRCFKSGHRAKNCRMNMKCVICGHKHLVLMCPELPAHSDKSAVRVSDAGENVADSNTLSTQSCSPQILLQTLVVNLVGRRKKRAARVVFDLGSQRSYILRKTAEELGYVSLGSETFFHALFGGIKSKRRVHHRYEVSVSSIENDFVHSFMVLDENVICGILPRAPPGPWLEELKAKNITITDLGSANPEIELLIGADVAGALLTGRLLHLESGPYAMETKLGWTLMGVAPERKFEESSASTLTSLLSLESTVADLWTLDSLGILDPVETKKKEDLEAEALRHFQETVKVDSEGRYQVDLPWTEGHPELDDHKHMAKNRLVAVSKKLVSEGRFEQYGAVFDEWLLEGVIEEVLPDERENHGYYLPHRGVFKEHSTTKVRPVFDASAHCKGKPSLNDCLQKGPNLIELIPSVLSRFREKEIGVLADIKKAFLQISVNPADRDFLRFFWWDNYSDQTLKIYRHRRVVFGVTSSPFLLGAVISNHLTQAPPDKRVTAEKLLKSFYVDNSLTSVSSGEELELFKREACALLESANFDLRGWENTAFNGETSADVPVPVLGMLWDKKSDELYCAMRELEVPVEPITKRKILSISHQVFDPLGFSSPVTLLPKLLLQKSWLLKIGWDSELPEDVSIEFKKWIKALPQLSLLRVPRRLSIDDSTDSWTLHTFCDASRTSYAATVFLRSENGKEVCVQLVQAKTRVAPLKVTTIPRMELLSCTIGARLAHNVKQDLCLDNVPEFYWSDSSTALYWIKKPEEWGTFVHNRVKEIRTISDPESWRHVPGVNNPADLPSRGCSIKTLLESKWWEGPEWLKMSPQNWPGSVVGLNEKEVNSEKRKTVVSTLISVRDGEQWYLKYFSRYTQILRMTAWIRRFLHNARHKAENRLKGNLSVIELATAEKCLLRLVQTEAFHGEEQKQMKSIGVFQDPSGLYRVRTMLTRRVDEEDFRCPILLPSTHQLTFAIIREEHLKKCHVGVQVLLSSLRERFWILKGRKTIRNVLNRCVSCRRFEAKKVVTPPAPLPEDRVKDASVFEVTGVDLTGPLYIKDGKKTWVVLYTCAVYRAVHLELVSSLSTEAFLQSFRRFIARRGRPAIVYSDNGTNFVGANNLMKELDWNTIEGEASARRIQWKFNPPTAAWWGGWWERLIQVLKRLLRRVLGRASLSYEQLTTTLCDAEAVINSRPLTYVSEDANDLAPLTPAMFLNDLKEEGVPDLDCIDRSSLSKRLRYRQRLRDDLRRRFRNEYLGQLVQRANESRDRQIAIGDIVLVGNDSSKRADWPMGRIVDTYPGRDKCVRVVRVKTSTGELTRPVQRVYPLEISALPENELLKQKIVSSASNENSTPNVFTRCGRRVKPPTYYAADNQTM